MTFAQPIWLVIGLIVSVALILLYRRMEKQRQQVLHTFAAQKLLTRLTRNVSSRRRTVKKILLLGAILCTFIALARPQYGFRWVDVKQKGIDILFAVDTSRSMLAEDISPNRLERTKFAIMDFVEQLEGDRVGLMPFAGSAFLMCPLTLDYNAFNTSLQTIDSAIIPKGGTDLGGAIAEADVILSSDANHKILILLTDGENLEGDSQKAAKKAAENGMTIYTVGVGTSEGELIPVSKNGKTGFIKDNSGKFITSKLDEKMLTIIAHESGGLYVPLGSNAQGLETIYQQKLSLIPKEELAERRHKIPLERFEYPLGVALFLLILEFLIIGRKSQRSFRLPFIKTAGRRTRKAIPKILLALLMLQYINSMPAMASAGEDAYNSGDFIKASELYSTAIEQNPDNPALHFNFGAAAYKNNMYDDAITAFNKALQSDNLDLQARAYYNRGNAQYKKGNETIQTDSDHTMKLWQEAIASYDSTLELNPADMDASHNRDLINKKLEQLKKQEKEQKQQEDQKQCDKKKDENEQGKDDKEKKPDNNQEQKQDNEQQGKPEQNQDQQAGEEQQEENKDGQQQDNNEQEEQPPGQPEEQDGDKDNKANPQEQVVRDEARRRDGKMTSEEAVKLLNSLKDEEGELNFVPRAMQGQSSSDTRGRDW